MKRICAVTGSRAEYGLLRPLLFRLNSLPDAVLVLAVTGSHLMAEFGNTIKEIEQDHLAVDIRIPIQGDTDTKAGMAKATGCLLENFAEYFANSRPDILIVLGDRYETFAAAAAAAIEGVPVAHIHGGETTEGAVDEFLRHSITKMSLLHFAASEVYRKRIIQLGESPDRVFNVGALGVENCLTAPLLSRKELAEAIHFDIAEKPYCVITLHPVTMENEREMEKQIEALIAAMDQLGHYQYIVTKSNADAGGMTINRIWDREALKHKNWHVTASLGQQRYLSALRYADMVIGNSSSGLLEAPAMGVATVNIGDRQRGRIAPESVITCKPEKMEIIQAMKKVVLPEFKSILKDMVNPFGDGHTSEYIEKILLDFLRGKLLLDRKKRFYDVSIEVTL